MSDDGPADECKRCEFALLTTQDPTTQQLQCRRNPPQFRPSEDGTPAGSRGRWPVVVADDWCGEFKPATPW